jgi:hypothetical protein
MVSRDRIGRCSQGEGEWEALATKATMLLVQLQAEELNLQLQH